MKRYDLLLLFFATFLLCFSNIASAQYWYQYGVRAGPTSNHNSGAAVTIQTITPQFSKSGSLGYWVGENLDNGAFLQVGYVIENESGMYPSFCDLSGCKNYQQINAGDAQWFYEYFPSGYDGGFLGELGPAGSVGVNGTFHRYAFYVSGSKWNFAVDGQIVGSVSLGTQSSGVGIPVAFGEVANTTGVSSDISQIIFSNLSFYQSGSFKPVQEGLSYIGYGVGSKNDKLNPYGVVEVGNRVNYFAVGSGLAQPQNNTILWNLGYRLNLISQYGNITNSTNYVAYSNVKLSSPSVVNLNQTTRVVFEGWQGSGLGSYTGTQNQTTVSMNSNVTETAIWQKQYYLNVSSNYGTVYGAGWYNQGANANYGVQNNLTQTSATSREKFLGWSNGNQNRNGTVVVSHPISFNANWGVQYLVNLQSQYGNVSGNGWYDNGSIANVSINGIPVIVNSNTRIGFYDWSNGNMNSSMQILVNAPVILSAKFMNMYLTEFDLQGAGGASLQNAILYDKNMILTNNSYLFSNVNYAASSAYYKGVKMNLNSNFTVNSPGTVKVVLPVYNVNVQARDIFGFPVNATVLMEFSNSSSLSSYTGNNGTLELINVPYGYVKGNISYLGITQGINAQSGSNASVIFVSILNIEIFAGVALIIVIAYFGARRHYRKDGYREEIEQGA